MAQPTPPARGSQPDSDGDHQRGASSPIRRPGRDDRLTPVRPTHTRQTTTPFAWQHERRLFLLEPDARGWILAELRFDDDGCRYVEIHRGFYRWTREAAGALLSRGLAAGEPTARQLASELTSWIDANRTAR